MGYGRHPRAPIAAVQTTRKPRKLDPSRDHELPLFQPWLHGKPDGDPGWWDPYLMHLARNGGLEIAAHHARVYRQTVWDYRQKVPAFDAAVLAAQAFYADSLEWRLVDQALRSWSPLGLFGRLKAERPDRWIDRHLIASLEVKADVPADQITEFLGSLVQHTTPATRALLGLPEASGSDEAGS
jgi:hypothetical protein